MSAFRRYTTLLLTIGLLSLGLSGCASGSTKDPVGDWGETGEDSPRLTISVDGTFTGDDGCNTLNGKWETKGEGLSFTGVSQTMMACPDVDTWLSPLANATIRSGALTVFNSDGEEIGTLPKR